MADSTFNATGTVRTGTIQQWTAPVAGKYRIIAYGAQGGSGGGLGAKMSGVFTFAQGDSLDIAVGQQGGVGTSGSQAGGGGSFVVMAGSPLLVAGGGGGYGPNGGVQGGVTTENGVAGGGAPSTGGTDGMGGLVDPLGYWSGASGAGFYGDGMDGGNGGGLGGKSWANGLLGGGGSGSHQVDGGFGGGGAGSWAGGAGGGYSGGGGGWSSGSAYEKYGGGGGGSYNAGADQDNLAATRSGDGLVEITLVDELFPLTVTSAWDHATDSYTLNVEWLAIDGATEYRLRLLDDTQALFEEITTSGQLHAFTGRSPDTTYTLELTGLDGSTDLDQFTESVTTGAGLPGGVSGLQHSFTTESLTFTWEAAKDAAEYALTLSLDGSEVATQIVTDLTSTFGTLEDGTQYDLAIQARNAQGDGPIAYYQASTGYLVPSPPINLRQFEERIIAVICRWDLVEPANVFDVQLQLLYGNELLFDEIVEPEQTERTFNVPMASTDYLLRVRAGNPAGWSDWAEGTVSSETFPLIDSRLGVMAATYQEDALYTDTWDGASDQVKGVVDSLKAEANVTLTGYAFETTFKPAIDKYPVDEAAVSASLSISASQRLLKKEINEADTAAVHVSLSISASERSVKKNVSHQEITSVGTDVQISAVEVRKQFKASHTDSTSAGVSLVISATETLP